MNVFISFAKEAKSLVDGLADTIRRGGGREWNFIYDMIGGRDWFAQLPTNINQCDIFMFVITEKSLKSSTCQKELHHATLMKKPIVTVVFNENILIPPPLSDIQYELFDNQSAASGASLIRAMQNSEPLNWEKIPNNWKTWDGKTKKQLSTSQDDILDIPLPKLRRSLSDREKQDFLYDSLPRIRGYFEKAIAAFAKSESRVEGRVRKTSDTGFICELYLDGKLNKSCRIWIFSYMDGIAYLEEYGRVSRDMMGNSYNEIAIVSELEGNPAFDLTLNVFTHIDSSDCQICTVEETSEHFWKNFTRGFGQENAI